MPTDLPAPLAELGFVGLAIAVLALAIRALWQRYNQVQDARVADHKEHSATLRDVVKTVDRVIDTVEARNGTR